MRPAPATVPLLLPRGSQVWPLGTHVIDHEPWTRDAAPRRGWVCVGGRRGARRRASFFEMTSEACLTLGCEVQSARTIGSSKWPGETISSSIGLARVAPLTPTNQSRRARPWGAA